MERILVVCLSGYSAGLLSSKMKKNVTERKLNVRIFYCALCNIEASIKKFNITKVLLAPQISWKYELREQSSFKKKDVIVIRMADYGIMNSEKILIDSLKK
ncbi:hypothetical protein [Enterococcus sp.]|uniref:PTS sugar transporter subunit IIB n=1 Tax=Enterococcus sp. TaxID=35783 RepID=UPI002906F721|nr:hypothetical protein [Enterococcus sp.]MDU5336720.1 hypothetical protein [Enterococcus sp.]